MPENDWSAFQTTEPTTNDFNWDAFSVQSDVPSGSVESSFSFEPYTPPAYDSPFSNQPQPQSQLSMLDVAKGQGMDITGEFDRPGALVQTPFGTQLNERSQYSAFDPGGLSAIGAMAEIAHKPLSGVIGAVETATDPNYYKHVSGGKDPNGIWESMGLLKKGFEMGMEENLTGMKIADNIVNSASQTGVDLAKGFMDIWTSGRGLDDNQKQSLTDDLLYYGGIGVHATVATASEFGFDPAMWLPLEKGTQFLGEGLGEIAKGIGDIEAVKTVFKPVAQAFSQKAYRPEEFKTVVDVFSRRFNEKAVEIGESKLGGELLHKAILDTAEELSITPEYAFKQIETAFRARNVGKASTLADVDPELIAGTDFTNPREYLEEYFLPSLGRERTVLEEQRLIDYQTALQNAGFRLPNEQADLLTRWTYPASQDGFIPANEFLNVKGYAPTPELPNAANLNFNELTGSTILEMSSKRGGKGAAGTIGLGKVWDIPDSEAPNAIAVLNHSYQTDMSYLLDRPDIVRDILRQQSVPEHEIAQLVGQNAQGQGTRRLNSVLDGIQRIATNRAREQGYDAIRYAGDQVELLYPLPRYQFHPKNTVAREVIARQIQEGLYKPSIADQLVEHAQAINDMDLIRRAQSLRNGYVEPSNNFSMYRHILEGMTPEAQRYLKRPFSSMREIPRLGWSPMHAVEFEKSLLNRGTDIFAMNALSEAGRAGEVSPLLEGFKGKIFVDSPAGMAALRDSRLLAKRTQVQVIMDAAKAGGMHESKAPADWVKLNLIKSKKMEYALIKPALKEMKFEPQTAKLLNDMFKHQLKPGEDYRLIRDLTDGYNWFMGNWRGSTLNFAPSYHLKNIAGAQLNMMIDKSWSPAKQTAAMEILAGVRTEPLEIAGQAFSPKELNRLRRSFGVGAGFITAEAGRDYIEGMSPYLYRMGRKEFDNKFAKTVLYPFQKAGKGVSALARGSYNLSQRLETTMRFGQFLELMDQGVSPGKAAIRVKLSQGDYLAGMTNFERSVMRNVFPFYYFTRMNLPFQVKGLFGNPKAFLALNKIMAMTQDDKAIKKMSDHEDLIRHYYGYLSESGLMRGVKVGEDGRIWVESYAGWLTMSDLEMLFPPNKAISRAVQSLNPILDGLGVDNRIYEMLQQPLPSYEQAARFNDQQVPVLGYPDPFDGFKAHPIMIDKRLADILLTFRPLNDMDRIFKAWTDNKLSKDDVNKVERVMRFLHGISTTKISIPSLLKARDREIKNLEEEYRYALRTRDKENAHILKNQIHDLKRLR